MGTNTFVEGTINALKYIDIIDKNVWSVVVGHFPDNDYVFPDNNALVLKTYIIPTTWNVELMTYGTK